MFKNGTALLNRVYGSMKIKSTLILLLLLTTFAVQGQGKYSVEGLDLKNDDFSDWYLKQTGTPSLFQVVGAYQPLSIPFADSNPFFNSVFSVTSEMSHRGKTFKNIELVYDQFQDMLFMVHPTLTVPIKLQNEYVDWFLMKGHTFKRIEGQPGFFEMLYEGNDLRLIKKNAQKVIGSQENPKYISDNKYFIEINGELKRVTNKRSVIKLFPDKKSLINSYTKQNLRSTFKEDLDLALTQLTELCDTKLKQ